METNLADVQLAQQVVLGQHQHVISAAAENGEVGQFIVHRPSMREEVKISVEYHRLKTPDGDISPADIDLGHDNMAYAIASLNVVVDQRPPFFPKDAGDCLDGDLLFEVFNKFDEWRGSFRRPVSGSQEAAG